MPASASAPDRVEHAWPCPESHHLPVAPPGHHPARMSVHDAPGSGACGLQRGCPSLWFDTRGGARRPGWVEGELHSSWSGDDRARSSPRGLENAGASGNDREPVGSAFRQLRRAFARRLNSGAFRMGTYLPISRSRVLHTRVARKGCAKLRRRSGSRSSVMVEQRGPSGVARVCRELFSRGVTRHRATCHGVSSIPSLRNR